MAETERDLATIMTDMHVFQAFMKFVKSNQTTHGYFTKEECIDGMGVARNTYNNKGK